MAGPLKKAFCEASLSTLSTLSPLVQNFVNYLFMFYSLLKALNRLLVTESIREINEIIAGTIFIRKSGREKIRKEYVTEPDLQHC